MRFNALLAPALAVGMALSCVAAARAQLFYTYQGELKTGGAVANGFYDFQFRVFDSQSGGTQVGIANQFNSKQVTDGKFEATFDSGAGVFNGQQRWLEVSVRPTGGGAFTTLFPRQRITFAPHAIHALTSSDERWTDADTAVIRTKPEVQRAYINRNTGIFPDEVFGVSRNTSPSDSFGGIYVNTTTTDGVPYYGWATGGTSRAEARFNGSTNRFTLTFDGVSQLNVSNTGLVGLGTIPVVGDARLQVNGDVRANAFRFSTPKTGYIFITPEEMRPLNSSHGIVIGYGLGGAFLDAAVTSGAMTAAFHVPHDATLTEVRFFVVDNSSAVNLSLEVLSSNGIAPGNFIMGSTSTAGASSAVQQLSLTGSDLGTVDASTRGYKVSISCSDWQGATTAVRGVRITYTVPEAQ